MPTTRLQWGRANDGAEISVLFSSSYQSPLRFNGAAPMMARKFIGEDPTREGLLGFNGAAPMMARKFQPVTVGLVDVLGFNGAAPMMARKLPDFSKFDLPKLELQWGRANDGAEMWSPVSLGSWLIPLQWGRANDGAEMAPSKSRPAYWLACFNGAAPMMARKCDYGRGRKPDK